VILLRKRNSQTPILPVGAPRPDLACLGFRAKNLFWAEEQDFFEWICLFVNAWFSVENCRQFVIEKD